VYCVKIPATSANLGPGFDCLGLALKLYNVFKVEPGEVLSLELQGDYVENISLQEDNLFWQAACVLWRKIGFKPQPLKIVIESYVPPFRGLGSSSTAVVGGLMIANALAGDPFSRPELLNIASEIEGHSDNVCPALYGGITLSVKNEGQIIPKILTTKPKFKIVVLIPEITIPTTKAREILPANIRRDDVVFNSSRVGLLVNCFLKEEYELLNIATQDRIHQNQRASLLPGMVKTLAKAVESGAYGATLSGAGPTLLAFSPYNLEQKIATAMKKALANYSINSSALVLDIDPSGAVMSKE
jgi:homoserine kinase